MKLRNLLFACVLVLTALLCLCTLPQQAQAATESDLTFDLNSDGNSYTVSDCKAYARGTLQIPTTYKRKPVTSIGGNAFKGCSSLTEITIPDSVTSIGYQAFYNCSSLTEITIPVGVTSIDNSVFSGCSSLTEITLPDSVTSIGDWAFYGCSSLTEITIPAGVTSIGVSAFEYCSSLQRITIPESVTSIDYRAFYNCSSLTEITLPDSVTSIGGDAFYGCSSLTDVYITDLSAWWKIAFEDYDSNPAYYADAVHVMDAQGNEVTEITLNDSVTAIPARAFYKFANITSITLPSGVTSIGGNAFYGCSSLTDVYITDPSAWWKIAFEDYYSNPARYADVMHVVDAQGNEVTEITLDDSVTEIPDNAFMHFVNITSITLPSGVTSIGSAAFYGCSSLTEITIPSGITSIGNSAFEGCSSLTEITIPVGVTSIGGYAFYNCSSLTDVYITDPSAWCKIDFEDYHSNPANYADVVHVMDAQGNEVTEITLDDSVTEIPEDAFYKFANITSITIPSGVTSIGDWAFYGCSSLTDVYITDLSAWWKITFEDYYSNPARYADAVHIVDAQGNEITEITLDDSLTEIPDKAFYKFANITSITLPSGVTSIGDSAFYYCSSLTEITIPEGVTSIGDSAFSYCSSLTEITIPSGVTSIGERAFYNCSSLKFITIPKSVTSIGEYAFDYNTSHFFYKGTLAQWEENLADSVSIGYGDVLHLNATGEEVTKQETQWGTEYHCSLCDEQIAFAPNVLSIQVETKPNKTVYFANRDTLNVTGGTLRVRKTDGSTEIIPMTNDMVSGFYNSRVGLQTLTVTYNTRQTTFAIEISNTAQITFLNADGSILSQKGYCYDEQVTVPENPPRPEGLPENYEFRGWNKVITKCAGEATYTAVFSAVDIADVATTSWQYAAVSYVAERGLMTGKGTDGQGRIKFDPNSPITREEFVQVLYNAEGKPTVDLLNPFPDVAENGWYKSAVLWAKKNNIANGGGDGNFGIGARIIRQDLALMLYKYARLKNCTLEAQEGITDQFGDKDSISGYAKEAMDWAVTNGILSGKGVAGQPLSTFRLDPTGTATRAECAAMLRNFMTAFGL